MNLADLAHGSLLDLARVICGNELGSGIARTAFVCRIDPTKVVKIENAAGSFQNVKEWEIWQALRWSDQKKWLAPCVEISPCGMVLIQARTETPPRSRMPKRVPRWMTDFKRENWGLYQGRVVCHDYGVNVGEFTARMRTPDWPADGT